MKTIEYTRENDNHSKIYYALVVTNSGQIISGTSNKKRLKLFPAITYENVIKYYEKYPSVIIKVA